MSKQKSRTQMMFSAGSEMKKGFTMPTIKKIKAVLRTRSKTFLVNLIISMMSGMSKTAKIKVLIKIDRRKVASKKKRKSTKKAKGKTAKRKKKAKNGRRGKGFAGQVKGSKKEKQMKAKAAKARKRKR